MLWKRVSFAGAAGLAAAALLAVAPPVVAGDTYRAPPPAPQSTRPAAPRVVFVPAPPAVSVSVSVTPQRPPAPYFVSIRGPDGQVRRFPVAGGRATIQQPSVVVLRPGTSVTFSLLVAR
jgi:hypothetical protein